MRKVIKNPYLILRTCLRDVSRRCGLLIEVYKRNFMKNLMFKLNFFIMLFHSCIGINEQNSKRIRKMTLKKKISMHKSCM